MKKNKIHKATKGKYTIDGMFNIKHASYNKDDKKFCVMLDDKVEKHEPDCVPRSRPGSL